VSQWFYKIHKPGSRKLKNGVSYITMILQKCGKLGAELENLCNWNYLLFVFKTIKTLHKKLYINPML